MDHRLIAVVLFDGRKILQIGKIMMWGIEVFGTGFTVYFEGDELFFETYEEAVAFIEEKRKFEELK